MNIKAIVGPVQLPSWPLHHHLREDAIFVPDIDEFPFVIVLGSFPCKAAIINKTEPYFLKQLNRRPLNVVKNNIVTFHPKEPHHSPPDGHPDFLNLFEFLKNTIRKNSLFPVERPPWSSVITTSHQSIQDVGAPSLGKSRG
jgi:hypothetical protein